MKRSVLFLLLSLTLGQLAAQPLVKDTAAYLKSAFLKTTGEMRKYKEGKLVYVNQYTITGFSLKSCTLEATVKMVCRQAGTKAVESYTLTYGIPLGELTVIAPGEGEDSTEQYKAGAIHFSMPYSKGAIHYKMTDDLTGRIEANGHYYAKTDLWCKPREAARVLEILKALRNRCKKNSDLLPCFKRFCFTLPWS